MTAEVIEFFIPAITTAKQSTRFGKKRAYADAKVSTNAEVLASYAHPHIPAEPWKGAIKATFRFEYEWRMKDNPATRAAGPLPKPTGPDNDNLIKQMGDMLQAMRFFKNDAQIAETHVYKHFTGNNGVHVRLEKLTQ